MTPPSARCSRGDSRDARCRRQNAWLPILRCVRPSRSKLSVGAAVESTWNAGRPCLRREPGVAVKGSAKQSHARRLPEFPMRHSAIDFRCRAHRHSICPAVLVGRGTVCVLYRKFKDLIAIRGPIPPFSTLYTIGCRESPFARRTGRTCCGCLPRWERTCKRSAASNYAVAVRLSSAGGPLGHREICKLASMSLHLVGPFPGG